MKVGFPHQVAQDRGMTSDSHGWHACVDCYPFKFQFRHGVGKSGVGTRGQKIGE